MSDRQIPIKELDIICAKLREALDFAGDVVEFGCYAGDTSVKLGQILQHTDKWLWLYDSFAGLPPKTAADQSAVGWRFQTGELKVSPMTVQHKFRKLNLPEPVIKAAWFNELDPSTDLPDEICFALLDGDYYESIQTSFNLVAPKLTNRGIIMVHDYRNPALPGSTKAVNEFVAAHPEYDFKLRGALAILQKIS